MAIDPRFFSLTPTSAGTLAQVSGCNIRGDGDRMIVDAAPLSSAGKGDLTFLAGTQDVQDMAGLAGAVVVTTADVSSSLPDATVCLISDVPRRDFAVALATLVADRQGIWRQQSKMNVAEMNVAEMNVAEMNVAEMNVAEMNVAEMNVAGVDIGPGAVVGEDVKIGEGSVIGPGVVIHHGVSIGRRCRIDPNTVLSHCDLADDVVIGAGSVIGGAGFGFEITPDGPVHLPHVGTVTIGNSSRIGAGCTIDRGTLGPTMIGRQVMIDNLVHIAHNCRIGDRAVLAAQVGLAGGAVIGEAAMLAGQAGVSAQVTVGRGAVVMGQSGVTKDVADDMTVVGFPAAEAREAWRERAALRRLISKSSQRKE